MSDRRLQRIADLHADLAEATDGRTIGRLRATIDVLKQQELREGKLTPEQLEEMVFGGRKGRTMKALAALGGLAAVHEMDGDTWETPTPVKGTKAQAPMEDGVVDRTPRKIMMSPGTAKVTAADLAPLMGKPGLKGRGGGGLQGFNTLHPRNRVGEFADKPGGGGFDIDDEVEFETSLYRQKQTGRGKIVGVRHRGRPSESYIVKTADGDHLTLHATKLKRRRALQEAAGPMNKLTRGHPDFNKLHPRNRKGEWRDKPDIPDLPPVRGMTAEDRADARASLARLDAIDHERLARPVSNMGRSELAQEIARLEQDLAVGHDRLDRTKFSESTSERLARARARKKQIDRAMQGSLREAADSMRKASTHKRGLEDKKGDRDNWVERTGAGGKGGQLPAYIQHIALAIHRKRGLPKSQAIAIAVSRVKVWAAGGGGVDSGTQAAARKALAEWTAMKAKAHAT